jgi:pyruvate/2-oxoglutarate dehydrogenase complex dihydrolipoamide acyltransferase (E2) component
VSSSRTERDAVGGGPADATGAAVEVTMPQMGVSVVEGTVTMWHKRVGDWVSAEETICEISTDKIDTDVPAPVSGRVAELVVGVGETVEVGTVLARIATDATPGEPHPDEVDSGPAAVAPDPVAPDQAAPDPVAPVDPAAPADPPGVPRRYSPVVQRIASEHGIDLERVEGSGRGGRVRKQDVLSFLEQAATGDARVSDRRSKENPRPLHIESPYRPEEPVEPAAPAASAKPAEPAQALPDGDVSEPLSRMRRSIGEHMLRSLHTAAHCTTIIEADMSGVEAARRRLGLSPLPFVARACIDALRELPALNATLEGETLTRHSDVNLGIAVSLGEDGLIVPVIVRAQDLSAEGLAHRISELATRARARELTPDDVRGGTFTITNPGAHGTIAATPIINQPQVAILDLEAIVKRPVVVSDARGDSIAVRPMVNLCLSWDHRALDGVVAAQFLARVRAHLEALES